MGDHDGGELSAADLREGMAVLEPYTAGELASRFDAPKRRVRALLERLSEEGTVRKKAPDPERPVRVRTDPEECPDCGYRYEVRFLHPVLSTVRFCPRCGARV